MYKIELTDAEVQTLGWAASHGYFPDEVYDAMSPEDPDFKPLPGQATTWVIPEQTVWAIVQQELDDPHSLFACIGDNLLRKLMKLREEIV